MTLAHIQNLIDPISSSEEDGTQSPQLRAMKEFFTKEKKGKFFTLYGKGYSSGAGSAFVHSILVPIAALHAEPEENLTKWNGNPSNSWTLGLVYGGGSPPESRFEAPLADIGVRAFSQGEQLVFSRRFEGRLEDKVYYEIIQSFTHSNDLHWVPESQAWCRFNEEGDVDKIIQVDSARSTSRDALSIYVSKPVIDQYCCTRDLAIVQMFDLTRYPSSFAGWRNGNEITDNDKAFGLHARARFESPSVGYVRGVHIVWPRTDRLGIGKELSESEATPKEYATFITQDWKNGRVCEVSCSPDAMASYFEKDSPLPFQISPVFFNARVLDKYRADSEKYLLRDRSIVCRNAWSLETYDVNEAGQVHTYIRYLGNLPYSEQLYWKSFNEAPKGPISRRSFQTDIRGQFDEQPDPLRELKAAIKQVHSSGSKWFTLRDESLLDKIHYPLTDSKDVWDSTLLGLAKSVVEGISRAYFEVRTKSSGAKGDPKWASIRWLEEWLIVVGTDQEVIAECVMPLKDLQGLRTKLSAHTGKDEAARIRSGLLRKHRSAKAHVAHISDQLAKALSKIDEVVARLEPPTGGST